MIPGVVIAILTFPGVIAHEVAHLLFCRLRRVAVLDACFFRFGNPTGYVIHEPITNFTTAFLVAVGPFLVNSLLCIAICLPAFVPLRVFNQPDVLAFVLFWLGISIGMHAFPSKQDALSLWQAAKVSARRLDPLAIVSLPLVVVMYVANILSVVWLDCLYGLAIGGGLPHLLFKWLL